MTVVAVTAEAIDLMPRFHDICDVSEISESKGHRCQIDQQMIGIYRVGDRFYAIADACPHAGASLSGGFLDDDVVTCRIHHWRFCVRNGESLEGLGPGYNVRTFPVRIVGDRVQVEA